MCFFYQKICFFGFSVSCSDTSTRTFSSTFPLFSQKLSVAMLFSNVFKGNLRILSWILLKILPQKLSEIPNSLPSTTKVGNLAYLKIKSSLSSLKSLGFPSSSFYQHILEKCENFSRLFFGNSHCAKFFPS